MSGRDQVGSGVELTNCSEQTNNDTALFLVIQISGGRVLQSFIRPFTFFRNRYGS